MASNAQLLMEKELRRSIVSYGRNFLTCNELKTEALLVITVDEDTSTRSVISVSDVSDEVTYSDADLSNVNFRSEHTHLKRFLENSSKSTLLETMPFSSIIKLYGIVTYEVNDGIFHVIKLDLEVKRSTETPMASGENDGGLLKEYEIGLEGNVTQTPERNCNQAIDPTHEEYYIALGLQVNDQKNIECSICKIRKGDIQLLQVHHTEVHNSFTCLVCAKMLKSIGSLKNHINIAHTPATIGCPFCSKKVHTKEKLRRHIVTHTEKKKSQPSNCSQEKPKTSNAEGTTVKKDNKSHVSQHQFGVHKVETGIKRELVPSSQVTHQSKTSNERALEQNEPKKAKTANLSKNTKNDIQAEATIRMHLAVTPQGPSRNTANRPTMDLHGGTARCGHCSMLFTRREYLETHLNNNPDHRL
ncbi:hypothetical protein ACF0H5_007985 [Mactra antiquata]